MLVAATLTACTTMKTTDEFLWLEEIESERALSWVGERNAESAARLEQDPRYDELRSEAQAWFTSDERIPYVVHYNGVVRNFWQDEAHVKGIVRTTTLDDYRSGNPDWTTLLDIDALAKAEGENWVYKGMECAAPEYRRCLVSLSRGGGDAVVIREFDLETGEFVEDGFYVPEAKTRIEWFDADRLLVATDEGEGSLTTSGYPRRLRLWERGTPLDAAPVVREIDRTETLISAAVIHRPEGVYRLATELPQFFRERLSLIDDDGTATPMPFPEDVDFRGVFEGRALALMRSDWTISEDMTLPAGALVAIDLEASAAAGRPVDPEVILAPADNMAIQSVSAGRGAIFVSVLEDVSGTLLAIRPGGDAWHIERLGLPDNGSIRIVSSDAMAGLSFVNFESFLVPETLYLIRDGEPEPEVIRSISARFDASPYVAEQRFAISADGTRIPYYVVRDRDIEYDGSNPVLATAYGGFEVSRTPDYFSALGVEWLRSGGVYVLANIRGGGEYGPGWHQAALLANRQRAYDDFIAVHEDLVNTGITSPSKLAISGGSNGGLLVMAVTAQRPDLYGAVICAVPLLDMLRYHTLSAGASWMGEYGNPDNPRDREWIAEYSPYQNIEGGVDYPPVFFWTNTRDDRVHPSHARRMVAKMQSQGHDVVYFENTEGGHGGGADPIALAHTTALQLVFLKQELGVR